MSNFFNGLQFGFAQGMFNNMFGFGGFGSFGGFWGNPFGCFCSPSCFMSPMYMVPRYGFGFTPYITPEAQVSFPALNIPQQTYSWDNYQNMPIFNNNFNAPQQTYSWDNYQSTPTFNNNYNVPQQDFSWGNSWGDTFTYSTTSTSTSTRTSTSTSTRTSGSTRTTYSYKSIAACADTVMASNPYVSSGLHTATDISKLSQHSIDHNKPRIMTMPDGTEVIGYKGSRFNKCRPEWIELIHYMLQAADEMGLTILFGDVERTVAASDAGRARKGDVVCRGGESPHNYGVAADIVLYKDGHSVNVNSDTQTAFANRVKELSGNRIEWGGDWRKAGERHHFNIKGWESKYKKPEFLVG